MGWKYWVGFLGLAVLEIKLCCYAQLKQASSKADYSIL